MRSLGYVAGGSGDGGTDDGGVNLDQSANTITVDVFAISTTIDVDGTNLVVNAVRYTPQGGEITIDWREDEAGRPVFVAANKADNPEIEVEVEESFGQSAFCRRRLEL